MIGMEYAAAKASPAPSKPPTLASSASSVHSTKPNGQIETPIIPHAEPEPEDDPRTQLIESLRAQLTDTHTQLTQLNSKLVQSYDRVSHLEDTLEITNSSLGASNARVSQLEAAQSAHEAALETGVLVEREHVAHELSRLMEKATEEAAQRGEADAARSRIETELDDLSADLFGRANTMVAEARIARAASERRVEEAENALKGAEMAVQGMQTQMQQMAEARRMAEAQVAEMRARMGKGKWVDPGDEFDINSPKRRLYNSHSVYREFTVFISHLRGLRATNGAMPQMSALISLPFLARLVSEDCDPTLRLDLAPALSWLTRRAVHTAILQGQLEIEPVYGLLETECALCGSTPSGSAGTSPTTAYHTFSPKLPNAGAVSMAAWASNTSKYFKGSLGSPTTSPQVSQAQISRPLVQRVTTDPNAPPVYIFRIANAQTTAGAAPLTLCSGGWCLARLRATCELCSFIKHGVVEKVWSEAPMMSAPPVVSPSIYTQGGVLGSVVSVLGRDKEKEKEKDAANAKEKDPGEAPPVPPRRRQLSSLGSSIWEKGLGAFGGSRTGSRSGTPAPEETKEQSPKIEHRLPPLPPPAPSDDKLSVVPPPPPPRARPVPPIPVTGDTDAAPAEHHEDIPHAMVFDAAADEHGHHAVSPATDKRNSIPPPPHTSVLNPAETPKPELASLPVVEETAPTAESASEQPSAPTPETEPTPAPETPRRPPPISRPPRTRLLPHEGDKPPMSPRKIALPESRSASPAPGERPESPVLRAISPTPSSSPSALRRSGSLRKDAEPDRASSPAPGSTSLGRTDSLKEAAGADGGPPKIPRRAARRAVPVPPGTPVAPTTEKPEEGHANTGDTEKTEEGEAKLEEKPNVKEEHAAEEGNSKVEERTVPRPPPRRAVPPPPAPPLPTRARVPKPVNEEKPDGENPVETAATVEEPKPAGDVRPIGTEPVQDSSLDPTSEKTPFVDNVTSKPPPVTNIVTSTTEDTLAQPSLETTSAPHSERPKQDEKNPAGATLNEEGKHVSDGGQFVGDQSWEERAYKQIVKLREDMFWARIGSAW